MVEEGWCAHGARGRLSRWHSSPSHALSFPPLAACPPFLSTSTVSHLPQAMLPSSISKHSLMPGPYKIPASLLSSTKNIFVTPPKCYILQRSHLVSSFFLKEGNKGPTSQSSACLFFELCLHPELSISLAQVPRGLRAGLCLHMPGGMHCQRPMKNKQLSCKDKEAACHGEAVVLSLKDVGLRS